MSWLENRPNVYFSTVDGDEIWAYVTQYAAQPIPEAEASRSIGHTMYAADDVVINYEKWMFAEDGYFREVVDLILAMENGSDNTDDFLDRYAELVREVADKAYLVKPTFYHDIVIEDSRTGDIVEHVLMCCENGEVSYQDVDD